MVTLPSPLARLIFSSKLYSLDILKNSIPSWGLGVQTHVCCAEGGGDFISQPHREKGKKGEIPMASENIRNEADSGIPLGHARDFQQPKLCSLNDLPELPYRR